MLPLRQPGWVVVASLSTSCSANVSLTLICALCHGTGKSAAALKTENAPKGRLIRPPHDRDEASVASEIVRTCRVASYQAVKYHECEGHRLAGCVLLTGRAEATCGPGVRHPKIIEPR